MKMTAQSSAAKHSNIGNVVSIATKEVVKKRSQPCGKPKANGERLTIFVIDGFSAVVHEPTPEAIEQVIFLSAHNDVAEQQTAVEIEQKQRR